MVLPKYSLDERLGIQREVNPPPPSIFIGLGFNNVPEDKKKHYRRYYPDELENVKEVMPKLPFTEIKVVRGQQRGVSKGFFSLFSKPEKDNTGQISTIKTVGKFKGIIKVYNKDEAPIAVVFFFLSALPEILLLSPFSSSSISILT